MSNSLRKRTLFRNKPLGHRLRPTPARHPSMPVAAGNKARPFPAFGGFPEKLRSGQPAHLWNAYSEAEHEQRG